MVNNNTYFCDNRETIPNRGNNYFISLSKGCKSGKETDYLAKRISENEYILAVLDLNKNTKIDKFFKIRVNQLLTSYKTRGLNTQSINNILFNSRLQTQIAKKEKIIEPKEKVKVAKKEELKVENKDIDNDAPVIEISERIVVDNQAYKLTGKVKDKSRFQLTIDDRPIKVSKNGKFEFEGFAVDLNEKLKIVAIDRWQNKSEKIVNVEVQYKEVADLRSYEEPNPGKIKVKQDRNKIAIIIGIEKYRTLKNIDAPYANRDANAFRAYANRALGIPNKNIKVLIDENATRAETLKALTLWLPQAAEAKVKIFIFSLQVMD